MNKQYILEVIITSESELNQKIGTKLICIKHEVYCTYFSLAQQKGEEAQQNLESPCANAQNLYGWRKLGSGAKAPKWATAPSW